MESLSLSELLLLWDLLIVIHYLHSKFYQLKWKWYVIVQIYPPLSIHLYPVKVVFLMWDPPSWIWYLWLHFYWENWPPLTIINTWRFAKIEEFTMMSLRKLSLQNLFCCMISCFFLCLLSTVYFVLLHIILSFCLE